MAELADLFKSQSVGTPGEREVLGGTLVRQGGKDYLKIDGSTSLWGPIKGAEALAHGDQILVGMDQLSVPYVIYPGGTGGGGGNEYYEQPDPPATSGLGAIWDDTDDTTPSGGGGGDLNFVHNQAAAAATWTVTHNLGKFPAANVVDSGGNWLLPNIQYVDVNTLTVTFANATSGKVYVN